MSSGSFISERSSEYLLFIQPDNDALTYCVFDPGEGIYKAFVRHPLHLRSSAPEIKDRLEEIIRKDNNLSLKYKEVRVLHYSQNSTLVPSELFDENLAAEYLRYNHYTDVESDIFTDFIEAISAYNVFSIPVNIISVFRDNFEQVTFNHHSSQFICNSSFSALNDEYTVHAGINKGFIDVAVFRRRDLELYNNFQYAGEADMLYYILFVYKQMLLDIEKTHLVISGEMSSKLSYIEILRQNILNIGHGISPGKLKLASELSSVNPNRYLNLLSMFTCVSQEENIKAEK